MSPNIDEAIKRMNAAIAELGEAVAALDVTNPTENTTAATCVHVISKLHRRIDYLNRLDKRQHAHAYGFKR